MSQHELGRIRISSHSPFVGTSTDWVSARRKERLSLRVPIHGTPGISTHVRVPTSTYESSTYRRLEYLQDTHWHLEPAQP